jgi:predicted RNA-binding Zn-ribbon protein involved in translation (DUF1610 family)
MNRPAVIRRMYNCRIRAVEYECPCCHLVFDYWQIEEQEPINNTKHYCPHCKVELAGIRQA